MCQIEPEGFCEVWEEHVVKQARKRHRCDGCHGFIKTGESYVSHFSVYDGEATSEKCCLPCRDVRDEFKKDHGWLLSPGSLHEYLTECIDAETLRVSRGGDGWGKFDRVPNATALKWQAMKDQMVARRDAAQAQVQT